MEVDVTQGKENVPITGPRTAVCFQYVKTNVPGAGFDETQFMEEFAGCSCSNKCDELSCPCVQLFGPAYDATGRLLDSAWCVDGNVERRSIFECGGNCACNKHKLCCLRVVYNGIREKLKVIETMDRGFGLQSVFGISRFSFVCEYAGEVVGEDEAKIRLNKTQREGKMNYLIAVKEHSSSSQQCLYVDPCRIGNIGRFINHSCDPNLIMIPARVNHPVPRLALFARRDISPGQELTFDYSGTASLQVSCVSSVRVEEEEAKKTLNNIASSTREERKVNDKFSYSLCLCGNENCSGYLPYEEHLFDE